MVVTCAIDFDDNPFGIYFAGQIVTGRITLESNKVKQVKAIALKIKGFAHTSWEESSSTSSTDAHGNSKTETTTTHYSGDESYLASITYLMGSEANGSSVIEPGVHTYTFACHLPLTCPSSFEGFYGHIRYMVKVVFSRPWKFDQTYTKGFTVLKIMDLNYDSPLLKVAANSEVVKTYCCGPCRSAPLKMQMTTPQSGYVPGQLIPVNLLITNDSNVPVEELKLELVMVICYYSQTPFTETKNERIVVVKLKGEPVLNHCKKEFNYELPVPATPPTCFNLCRIIQIAYQIELEAKVKGFHANQVLCLPVTIGNVPLMDIVEQQPSCSSMQKERSLMSAAAANETKGMEAATVSVPAETTGAAAIQPATMTLNDDSLSTPTPWSTNASMPPPTYEEAVHMRSAKINADEAHDYGQTDFTPRYTVFSFASPSAPQAAAEDDIANAKVEPNKSTWL